VVAGLGVAGGRGHAAQDGGGVDLVLAEGEPVAGGGAGDDLGTEPGPGPGDQHLQRLGRMLGRRVRPDPLDQPAAAAARAQVAGEQPEQAPQPGAGDLLAAVRHPRQQGQRDGHPPSLASRPAAVAAIPGRATE
jgi:hypothetical protein